MPISLNVSITPQSARGRACSGCDEVLLRAAETDTNPKCKRGCSSHPRLRFGLVCCGCTGVSFDRAEYRIGLRNDLPCLTDSESARGGSCSSPPAYSRSDWLPAESHPNPSRILGRHTITTGWKSSIAPTKPKASCFRLITFRLFLIPDCPHPTKQGS